jgi:RimJ/RimL family protein N-acetyltransferase
MVNNMEPITTERLTTRPWRESDCDVVVENLNNFEVAKWITCPWPYAKKDFIEFITKEHKGAEFAIVLKATGEVVGGSGFSFEDEDKTVAGGGIWIAAKHQGKGYGTEFYGGRTKYLLDVMGVHRVISAYFADNPRSKHMHEKIGFVKYGEGTNFCPARGMDVPNINVEMVRKG